MGNSNKVKLSAIQLTSGTQLQANLTKIEHYLAEITALNSPEAFQHLVVLPECCLLFGGKESDQLLLAKSSAKNPAKTPANTAITDAVSNSSLCNYLSQLAQQYKVNLVAGSVPLLTASAEQFTNSSCVFGANGAMMGRYDKIHLFDVTVSDKTKSYQESRYTQAGKDISVIAMPFAKIGLTICFDLRFPKLFQQLSKKGADIITVPSAFTKVTGKAHWETLLKARAIENQVYIIAAGQVGVHENGRETWGHSMIINPWGEIEQTVESGEGFISVDYNGERINDIRQRMPLISPLN